MKGTMADKFFDDDAQTEDIQADEAQTIKLGDKEYSQDDLSRLVGLGEMAQEAEEKYKTPIGRVWPEYTKATQKLSDYEKKIQDLESRFNQSTVQAQSTTEQLTEEQKQYARKQLDELGYGQEQFRAIVREELAAKELLGNVDVILSDAQDQGQPVTTPQELLQHMAETGIRNPAKAYKDMFEAELDAIKERKLAEIKPQGMVTTTSSQAGAKQPAPAAKPRNREELTRLVQESLSGN